MKNFRIKFSGAFFFLIGLFFFGSQAQAGYLAQYQAGVEPGFGSTDSYSFGVLASSFVYQEINFNNSTVFDIYGNGYISGFKFPIKESYSLSGVATLKLYKLNSDFDNNFQTIETQATLLGTLTQTLNTVPVNTWGEFNQSFLTNIALSSADTYFVKLSANNIGYNHVNLYYYDTIDNYPTWWSKYVRSADGIVATRNYDFIITAFLDDTMVNLEDYGIIEYNPTIINYYDIVSKPYPDFTSNFRPVCFTGQDCNIWIQYNEAMIGEEIQVRDTSNNIIASTTITEKFSKEINLVVASTTTEFKIYSPVCYDYEVASVSFSGCGVEKSGYNIFWTTTSEYFPDMSYLDDPCYDIATSSGTFSDDFRYGLECGTRKVVTWLIYPSDKTWLKLTNTIDDAKNNFPLNIVNNVIQEFSATTTASTSLQLLPLLDENAEPMAYMIDENNFNDDTGLIVKFRSIMAIILYFLLLLYFIKRVVGMAHKNDEV